VGLDPSMTVGAPGIRPGPGPPDLRWGPYRPFRPGERVYSRDVRPLADLGGPRREVHAYALRLYISGRAGSSSRAVRHLEAIASLLEGVETEVIDVRQRPDLAEEDKVLATPMLMKRRPPPIRKIIGDLSDPARVVSSLGLEAARAKGAGGASA
jgi:circadian clock protein KaiB